MMRVQVLGVSGWKMRVQVLQSRLLFIFPSFLPLSLRTLLGNLGLIQKWVV